MSIDKISYALRKLVAKKKLIYAAQVDNDDELDGITIKEVLEVIKSDG